MSDAAMIQNRQQLLMNSRCATIRRWHNCLLAIAVLSWLFSAGFAALAGDFVEEEDDDAVPVAGERQIVFTVQQFDQMIFGAQQVRQVMQVVRKVDGVQVIESVATPQPSEAAFRNRMEATAAVEIEAVDRRVSLTEGQKKKLKLAARGDIAQVVSRAAELRPKMTAKPMTQQQYTELMKELQPLRMSQQYGIIGENSLFRKTLRRTLTGEQRVHWQVLERERQKVVIETAIQTWQRNANGLKLTDESRQKFIELILDHGQLPQSVGPYGQYIVLLEANLLRDRLEPLLTAAEWEKFETQLVVARRVEPTLENYGLWTARRSNEGDESSVDATKD